MATTMAMASLDPAHVVLYFDVNKVRMCVRR